LIRNQPSARNHRRKPRPFQKAIHNLLYLFINFPRSGLGGIGTAHAFSKAQEMKSCESTHQPEVGIMKWDTPSYSDIRFGFEVTMYINNK
jgi:coenzyme PQQ precursor peptide PqqA